MKNALAVSKAASDMFLQQYIYSATQIDNNLSSALISPV
jgi:hypothetical protein